MKAILFIVSFIFGAAVADIAQVRQKYIAATESATASDELYTMLEGVPDTSKETTMVAYKAAAIMLQARYAKGIVTKKSFLKKVPNCLKPLLREMKQITKPGL
ncbi:hypothetical protein LRS05_04115 [Flavobacterium sp. J372]|uniref:hypothetical protein n=1 Tax=Flavobacterium sp. J372 TaxID=2898436 RepID=UPI002151E77F|nr:hypothetical protein [Flavobacterium sp. J372]MCR5861383.1 hypothetical protein [Flavobacterium sp. J372]